VQWIARLLLGHPKTERGAQLRMLAPTGILSGFMNNTAVVAMFIPAIQDWAKRLGIPSSRHLLPLSYAAILGWKALGPMVGKTVAQAGLRALNDGYLTEIDRGDRLITAV